MSRIDFTDRVAVVTGAGNGLGKDYAIALAARGAKVVVNDLGGSTEGTGGSRNCADEVVEKIIRAGGTAVASYDSVGTRTGGEGIIDTAMNAFGKVDIVINNAGNQRNNKFEDMTEEEFDAVINVHLKGAFFVSQPAYKVMLSQQYGRFVFTSSASGMFGNYIRTNYASAKAGLVGMMHSIALEGQRHGILANAILPCAASRLGQAPAGSMYPEWEAGDPRHKPGIHLIGAKVIPEYVTPLTLYLASEQCKSSHAMWSALGGRYARVFVGATKGWFGPDDRPATPEEIADHLTDIEDPLDFCEPLTVSDEFDDVISTFRRISG
jgi:NAD(P)-dependent dehydrogenase (short-subunit alcohol dehydrogenase family)